MMDHENLTGNQDDSIVVKKKSHETTQIASFLTGGDIKEDDKLENTLELDAFEFQPDELHSEPDSEQPVRKRKRQVLHKEKKVELSGPVRVLSRIVAAALVIYVVLNVYWTIFGVKTKETSKATAEPSSEVETTSAPSSTQAASSTSNGADSNLGTLTVDIEAITVRDEPSLSGTQTGSVYSGETYTVYDRKKADGYTWYEIDESGEWIASDGTWVTYSGN